MKRNAPSGPKAPNFKPRRSGAIRSTGPVKPYEPPANKPKAEGVRKSLYVNK